jgi:alcohol dehydrogenase (cytochrome c)
MKDKDGSLGSWATLIGAVVVGAVVALIVGILIGNGTEQTKTVTLGQADVLLPQTKVDRSKSPSAPAFTPATLNALPTTNWITNGGSIANQRYSPLTQINTTNVSKLKGVWMTQLDTVSTTAKYSQETQPIVYNGVMYVSTGADEVYAMDVASGDVKWKYDAQLDQSITTVCCGWDNRGVAIGDGKVYVGQLDGKVVALDMRTGKVIWTKQVDRWQDGYTITHAPLYYEGRVVVGVAGGEFGIRGRVEALDAKTGGEAWRFYTVPDPTKDVPGQGPNDTWPKDKDSWKTGGAPVWQTPSVDPELGMLYFSTGNAAPDVNGEEREGDNLFSSSIVALDVKTGKYKWHFQQVHHDIWDYDGPSPTILYDANVNGKVVHGIAEASKTGWLYMLDRKTGKPIFPINEKPVPQDPNQKTAATQPYPTTDAFARHELTDADYKKIMAAGKAQIGQGKSVDIKRGKIFDPFGKDPVAVLPGPTGGDNWPPASYNQKLQMFYICSQNSPAALAQSPLPGHKAGEIYIGSLLVSTGFNGDGNVTAIDAQTGKIVWQISTPDSCYSGTVTTAGNLVFVGRNTGELQAYDARNGSRLWSFQTGAGANSTVTTFTQDNEQYVAFAAGGNSLAGTPRGRNVWLFSLNGTMDQLKGTGDDAGAIAHAGEQVSSEESEQTEDNTVDATTDDNGDANSTADATADNGDKAAGDTKSVSGDAAAGKQVFADNCSTCHGADGKGGNGGPDLTGIPDAKDTTKVIKQVTGGGGGMPAFSGQLSAQQIADVSAFVVSTING